MKYESEYTKMLKTKSVRQLTRLYEVNWLGMEKAKGEYPRDLKRIGAYKVKLNQIIDEIVGRK